MEGPEIRARATEDVSPFQLEVDRDARDRLGRKIDGIAVRT